MEILKPLQIATDLKKNISVLGFMKMWKECVNFLKVCKLLREKTKQNKETQRPLVKFCVKVSEKNLMVNNPDTER